MILKKIKLENIRSYDSHEIVFPEGSVLLSGDIGAGKTSILLAIEFALFGLQPGQRGSSLLSSGKNYGSVILDFEVDNDKIIIERKLKRTSKSVNQDYASLTLNNEKIESSVTEIKSRILGLLNYPDEFLKKNNILYKYTVYTPQEQMKQIILDDAESRLDTLRFIFGVDKYKRIKNNLSIILSKIKEEYKSLQVEIRLLDEIVAKIVVNKNLISALNVNIKEKEDKFVSITSEKLEKEKEVLELENKIREKEKFLQEVEKSKIMLSNKSERLTSAEASIGEIEEKLSKSVQVFDEQHYAGIINSIEMKNIGIEELNKNYISIASKINSFDILKTESQNKKERIFKIDICPTCLQDVSEVHKHNILNETEGKIRSLELEKQVFLSQKTELEYFISAEKKSIIELENKKRDLELIKIKMEDVPGLKKRLEEYKKERASIIKDIDSLNSHIKALKYSVIEFSKYDSQYRVKKEEFQSVLLLEKKAEIEIAELKKEAQIIKGQIVELENKLYELEKVNQRLIKLMDLERWLSEDFLKMIDFTEKNILYKLRSEFSKLFNKWFSFLTTDSFSVQLDENFTPIISQGEFEFDYSYLSGGERTAVALAYRLALNQILNSLLSKIKTRGLIILDEPTDGFSDQQLDKIRDILQELKAKQLIIVSHEQKIESFVDNVIRLKKTGQVSSVAV